MAWSALSYPLGSRPNSYVFVMLASLVVYRSECNRLRDALQPISHDAVIRVYDEAGNVIETHEHAREFKER
jgi:hypothetical protein